MPFAPRTVALRAGEGRRIEAMGSVRFHKAIGADTGGAWSLVELHSTGADPPLHRHSREDEAFYVLEGRARVWVGDAEFDADVGSFVLAPRGIPHTYAAQPESGLTLLVWVAPAGFERMFDEIALLATNQQHDLAVMARIAARYGVQILGPPRPYYQ